MTNEQIIKEFDEKCPGYSMNEYNPGEKPIIRPIMCQREDAKAFILQVRTDTINEIREEAEERKFEELVSGKLTEVVMLEDIKTFLNKLDI